jgi:hypothetical protein
VWASWAKKQQAKWLEDRLEIGQLEIATEGMTIEEKKAYIAKTMVNKFTRNKMKEESIMRLILPKEEA